MVGIVRVHLELHGAGAGVPLHTISRDDENWFEGAPAETQAWLNGYRIVMNDG